MSEKVIVEHKEIAVKPFAYWQVGDEEYKLKLKTANIVKLEERLGKNLLSLFNDTTSVPPLKIMLAVTHEAMLPWHHGIKLEDVYAIYDRYCEEGGSQLEFMANVFMDIFVVSGFFTRNQSEMMSQNMEEAKLNM